MAASSNRTLSSVASSDQPVSTLISTITTTLTSRKSLPTSVIASASHNGSVYFLPITTVVPVTASSTSSAPLNATAALAPAATSSAVPTPKVLTILPLHTVIDPAFGVLGGILILSGLPMTFYGHRNRWSSYFLAGFFAAALLCISIIFKVGVEPAVNPPSKGIRGLFLVAAVVAGAIGGVLSILFWRGAGLFACGLGGFFLGLFLQAVRPGGLIESVGLRYILYVGLFAVIFSVSCIERMHSLTLAFATAVIGATSLTLGIDCFSTQGLKEFYIRNIGFDALFSSKSPPAFQDGHFPLVQGMQIELGVLGALILMGIAFQLRLWSDLRQQLVILRRSDHRRNMRSKAERAARAVAQSAKHDLAEWEARHGYSKTASSVCGLRDEEKMIGSDEIEKRRSRSHSFMSRLRSNSDATQLETPESWQENRLPSSATFTIDQDVSFPAAAAGSRNVNFIDYIKKGPEKVQNDSPNLRLNLSDEPVHLGFTSDSTTLDTSAPKEAPPQRSDYFYAPSRSIFAQQGQSLDLNRGPAAPKDVTSFRTRSASTAALMENEANFLNLPKEKESSRSQSLKPTPPLGSPTMGRWTLNLGSSQQLGAHSDRPTRPAPEVKQPLTTALGNLLYERTQPSPLALTDTLVARPIQSRRSFQDQFDVQPGLLNQRPKFQRRISTDGDSPGVLAAPSSFAMKREERAEVPWTGSGGPYDSTNEFAKRNGRELSPHIRAMSIEELGARHRAKLAALQKPANAVVQEADELRKAKEQWERKQMLERRRMQERDVKKISASVTFDQHIRDEARRSRSLSVSFLQAVEEDSRQMTGLDRAAEWSISVSGTKQLDPRVAMPPILASAPGNFLASSTQGGVDQANSNPFTLQSSSPTKLLSDTDRRRLSQGAGGRLAGQISRPLLDFKLPETRQAPEKNVIS